MWVPTQHISVELSRISSGENIVIIFSKCYKYVRAILIKIFFIIGTPPKDEEAYEVIKADGLLSTLPELKDFPVETKGKRRVIVKAGTFEKWLAGKK